MYRRWPMDVSGLSRLLLSSSMLCIDGTVAARRPLNDLRSRLSPTIRCAADTMSRCPHQSARTRCRAEPASADDTASGGGGAVCSLSWLGVAIVPIRLKCLSKWVTQRNGPTVAAS